jgi:hypothetical protein
MLSDEQQEAIRGKGAPQFSAGRYGDEIVARDGAAGSAAGPAVDTADADEEQRKSAAPSDAVETVTRNQQGYFGDRLSFELGASYSHFDDAQINLSGFLALDAIFLGLIGIDETTADVVTTDLTVRYGVTDRLQVDLDWPTLFRWSNFKSAGAGGDASGFAERDVFDKGMGDINGGISYRLFKETTAMPDVVVNVRGKAPTGRDPFGVELEQVAGTDGNLAVPARLSTGSGVWGASFGVSMLKTLDPLVVFGNVTYFHNFTGKFGDIDEAIGEQPGSVDLGDAIQFGAGIAFALNDRSSLSGSFTERFVSHTRLRRTGQPWFPVVGSQANVGIFNMGASFALNDRLSLLTTVGIGMTRDAPYMVLNIRIPFRF